MLTNTDTFDCRQPSGIARDLCDAYACRLVTTAKSKRTADAKSAAANEVT